MTILRSAVLTLTIFCLNSISAEGAFIVQPNGKGDANFDSPSGIRRTSDPADNGILAAMGLTFGAPSIFGGDEYRFSYTPGTDGDNTTFAPGARRNSFATYIASGLPANASRRYRVYRAHPQTQNVSGGLTNYEIFVNGATQNITQAVDQNLIDIPTGLATGANIGLWELIGEVTVTDPSDTITVVQKPTNVTYVSMRSGGILFEAIPEPATGVLLVVSALATAVIRRRFR